MATYQGEIAMSDTSSRVQSLVINYLSSTSTPISDITNDKNFYSMLENKVQVSDLQSGNVNSKQYKALNALDLAKR